MIRFTLSLFLCHYMAFAEQTTTIHKDHFGSHIGTIVIADHRTNSAALHVHNPSRASSRLSPASTFKIPHTLFALDTGLIQSTTHVIPWDKTQRAFAAWNKDQTLRSAMKNSTVWVYEGFARQLGEKRESAYLRKIQYGNQKATGTAPFWIKGDLRISADEQIEFLKRLYHDNLPFKKEHLTMTKEVMTLEQNDHYILRGKSGWTGKLAWWVGWVEHAEGPVFFAINVDTPNGKDDLPFRELITRSALRSIGALPVD